MLLPLVRLWSSSRLLPLPLLARTGPPARAARLSWIPGSAAPLGLFSQLLFAVPSGSPGVSRLSHEKGAVPSCDRPHCLGEGGFPVPG